MKKKKRNKMKVKSEDPRGENTDRPMRSIARWHASKMMSKDCVTAYLLSSYLDTSNNSKRLPGQTNRAGIDRRE